MEYNIGYVVVYVTRVEFYNLWWRGRLVETVKQADKHIHADIALHNKALKVTFAKETQHIWRVYFVWWIEASIYFHS